MTFLQMRGGVQRGHSRRFAWQVLVLLAGLLAGGCTADSPLAAPVRSTPAEPRFAVAYDSYLGDADGVAVYSNGSTTYFSNVQYTISNYTGGSYSTGYKWQCVEFVVRYYWLKYNLKIRDGHANTFFRDAEIKGLNRYENGGVVAPQVGDILVSEAGLHGHVAVVRAVGPDYVIVAQQNLANASNDVSTRMAMTFRWYYPPVGPPSPSYRVAGFNSNLPVRGWVRRR
jgi:surface antigen